MEKPVNLPELIKASKWKAALARITKLAGPEAGKEVGNALDKPVGSLEDLYNDVPWKELSAKNYEALKDLAKIEKELYEAQNRWKTSRTKLLNASKKILDAAAPLDKKLGKKSREIGTLIDQTEEFCKACPEKFDDRDFQKLLAGLGATTAKQQKKEEEQAKETREEEADFEDFQREAKELVAPIKRLIAGVRAAAEAGEDAVVLVKQIIVEYDRRGEVHKKNKESDKNRGDRKDNNGAHKLWNYEDQSKELESLGRLIDRNYDEVVRQIGDMFSSLAELKSVAARRKGLLLKEVNAGLGFCGSIKDDCKDLGRLKADTFRVAKTVGNGDRPNQELKPFDTRKLVADTNRLTRKIREWQKMEPKTK